MPNSVTDAGAELQLNRVVKRYGTATAVDDVSLSIDDGVFLTILGPSGSGKTTILRMIAGFTDVTEGQILLGGEDVALLPPDKRNIGMVFQNYALFPHLSVARNIEYPLKMHGWAAADRKERIGEVLELVGMRDFADRMPAQLSGGQQQRVALARAISFRPKLLLMDEPLGALDRALRVRMAGELRALHEELNNTVIYVTHDREEALTLSDRIAIMLNGKIVAEDGPQKLYSDPDGSFVASFFGAHNVLVFTQPSTDAGETREVQLFGRSIKVRAAEGYDPSEKSFLVVPAAAIHLGQANVHRPEDSVEFTVEVISGVYMGDHVQIVVRTAEFEEQDIIVAHPGTWERPPSVGSRLQLWVAAGDLKLVN